MTYTPDTAPTLHMPSAILAAARTCSMVDHLLGPAGPIAQNLPGWQDRPQQRALGNVVRRAFKQGLHALTEGECGVGKTHALLVPAILHALETKKPVVVSTKTNILLDQYVQKDLPFLLATLTPWLEEKFGRTFDFAGLKGLGNYRCNAKKDYDDSLEYEFNTEREWQEFTTTGDVAELPFTVTPRLRSLITATREECAGARCPVAKEGVCWFINARRAAHRSDIVVVNHVLLMAALRAQPGTVLPIWSACIVDEAHELEAEARSCRGVSIAPQRVAKIAKQALDYCGTHRQGMLGEEPGSSNGCDPNWPCNPAECGDKCECDCHGVRPSPTAEAIAAETRGLFQALQHEHRAAGEDGQALLGDLQHTAAGEYLNELCAHLRRLAVDVENTKDELWEESAERAKGDTLSLGIRDLVGELASLRQAHPDRVAWLQLGQKTSIQSAPLEVANFLKDSLLKAPVALSSATLATGTGADAFAYIQETLGVRTLHQIQAGSPFDWPRQCWLYLPEGLTEKHLAIGIKSFNAREEMAREYARISALHIREFLHYTRGRTFCLFTAGRNLELTREALLGLPCTPGRCLYCKQAGMEGPCSGNLPFPYMSQGERGVSETLDWFRSTQGAVLFGLASYWEGVDVSGDALSGLVIDRIPFPAESDVLHQARLRALGGGRSAFKALSVPIAITKKRQGFGRLIRTVTDRGAVMLLDPRLHGKHAAILDALPPARRIHRADLRRLPLFLAGAGVPCKGPAEVAAALQGLALEGMPREHAQIVVRLREMLPGRLTSGLWGVAEKLVARYRT